MDYETSQTHASSVRDAVLEAALLLGAILVSHDASTGAMTVEHAVRKVRAVAREFYKQDAKGGAK